MAEPKRYGIRVIHHVWGAVNGGPDVVGSREEMEALAAKWDAEPRAPNETLIFRVEEYTGDDPAARAEVERLLNGSG
jgi:hypothetical protein